MLKPISKINRLLLIAVIASLGMALVLPLWKVSLAAPQYPEGLGLYIWVNKITGGSEFDLQNINLLNHYIGMANIEADSIPELKFMPYIVYYMIAGALVTLAWPRLIMVALGLVNFVLVSAAGLYDFYRWEYDYGHNLNPEAPIIIPGMAYQPPLLGSKEILNITADSWPNWGGIFLIAAGMILAFIVWSELRARKALG